VYKAVIVAVQFAPMFTWLPLAPLRTNSTVVPFKVSVSVPRDGLTKHVISWLVPELNCTIGVVDDGK